MKSYITKHLGDNDNFVFNTIKNHPEWYGHNRAIDLMRVQFWDIIDKKCNLLGFFGCSYRQLENKNECIICYVFVKEEYRKQGLFKKLIDFVIDNNTEFELITIGSTWKNELALSIYSKKFEYLGEDEEENGTWFSVKNERKE